MISSSTTVNVLPVGNNLGPTQYRYPKGLEGQYQEDDGQQQKEFEIHRHVPVVTVGE